MAPAYNECESYARCHAERRLRIQDRCTVLPALGGARKSLLIEICYAEATLASVNALSYLPGFGNEHMTEARAGALPVAQNSPQHTPLALYTEQLSGTAFMAPRAQTVVSWLYRVLPSARHGAFKRIPDGFVRSAPVEEVEATPDQLRWNPLAIPESPTDFIDGCVTLAANGNAAVRIIKIAGELLIVPQTGALRISTELGVLEIAPGEIAVLPRGVRFGVELLDATVRGYTARIKARYSACRSSGRSVPTGSRMRETFFIPWPRSRANCVR
jgi:homogentisate 1,2-dioxygenase